MMVLDGTAALVTAGVAVNEILVRAAEQTS